MNYKIPNFKEVEDLIAGVSKNDRLPPDKKEIKAITDDILSVLFPLYFHSSGTAVVTLENLYVRLATQISVALKFSMKDDLSAYTYAEELIKALPNIKALLVKDIEALYAGDPAAICKEEVLLSYPGFYAIAIYRIAHNLYEEKIPLIPRIMTEYAHEKTGIDIHAGAKIGEYFFIDHGTGIVIGETTTIGNNVKIYQGVTLGAKSFELDENGNPVKGTKRHPDIGNNVVIYANATILGGNTRIGDGCVIGGNVWLIHSVEPGSKVYYGK